MSIWQAIVYGIVQGLTEYLPISSTAHLRIVPEFLGWEDPGAAFTAVIQWGTLIAVMLYFRSDIGNMSRAMLADVTAFRFGQSLDSRLGWMVVVGTIPIVICGVLFQKWIKTSLRSLYVISATLIVLALLLTAAEMVLSYRTQRGLPQKELDQLSWFDAIAMGFAQACALIPGVSRSGVTITCGLFAGLSRETAARFSFLLALPSVFAAGVYELIKDREKLMQSQQSTVALGVATVVAGLVGYATIAFLLGYLKRHTTYVFVGYRIMLGIVLLILLAKGRVSALPH